MIKLLTCIFMATLRSPGLKVKLLVGPTCKKTHDQPTQKGRLTFGNVRRSPAPDAPSFDEKVVHDRLSLYYTPEV